MERVNLTLVSLPEKYGGAGGMISDIAAILRLVGFYAAPVPLAETGFLAGWMLSASGLMVPQGPLAAAPVHRGERIEFRRENGGWRLSGCAKRVPAARTAERLAITGYSDADERIVASVDPDGCGISPAENLAGEVRDDVVLDGVRVESREAATAGAGVSEEALLCGAR